MFYPPLISFIKGRNTAAGSLFSDAERERAVALDGHLLKVRGLVECVNAYLNALDAYILFFSASLLLLCGRVNQVLPL